MPSATEQAAPIRSVAVLVARTHSVAHLVAAIRSAVAALETLDVKAVPAAGIRSVAVTRDVVKGAVEPEGRAVLVELEPGVHEETDRYDY